MLAIIGQVIRQLREENSITLEELSSRAGISIEKLDNIERNQTNASLGVLIRISRALGDKVGTLFTRRDKNYSAVVTRKNDVADNLTFAGNEDGKNEHLRFYALATEKVDRRMEPSVVEITPSGDNATTVPELKSEHSGEEFIYVLEGRVTLYYGTKIHHLESGDSIYYDSAIPHFLANETNQPAKVLTTLYTPY